MMDDFPFTTLAPVRQNVKRRTLYRCSSNAQHRVSLNTARSNAWFCPHCGAELAARENQLARLRKMAAELGFELVDAK